jgi:6-phosphofructokinase 1
VSVKPGNACIGQSGGPTAVINQSLVGVIEEIRKHSGIRRLYGAIHGVKGIVNEDLVDLLLEDAGTLETIACTPAAALGSTRDKPDERYCEKIFDVFRRKDVRYFFYIGGNDSADTARIVAELGRLAGYDLNVFHIPKTIDNDLLVTDHCPGYGSAARFVASCTMGDDMDNRSLPGIKINIIMGRHAGFLTAASALARQDEDDGPHLVYVPEVPFDLDRFLDDVQAVYARHGRCVCAVSEGIEDKDGNPIQKSDERDSHGNMQLSGSGALGDFLAGAVKIRMGRKMRVRADTYGYLQRSFPACTSEVDAAEARLVGRAAVQFAARGDPGGSVALRRLGDGNDYAVDTFAVPLIAVARHTKPLEAAYIAPEGNNVTPAFVKYARPLVGRLPAVARLSQLRNGVRRAPQD